MPAGVSKVTGEALDTMLSVSPLLDSVREFRSDAIGRILSSKDFVSPFLEAKAEERSEGLVKAADRSAGVRDDLSSVPVILPIAFICNPRGSSGFDFAWNETLSILGFISGEG